MKLNAVVEFRRESVAGWCFAYFNVDNWRKELIFGPNRESQTSATARNVNKARIFYCVCFAPPKSDISRRKRGGAEMNRIFGVISWPRGTFATICCSECGKLCIGSSRGSLKFFFCGVGLPFHCKKCKIIGFSTPPPSLHFLTLKRKRSPLKATNVATTRTMIIREGNVYGQLEPCCSIHNERKIVSVFTYIFNKNAAGVDWTCISN